MTELGEPERIRILTVTDGTLQALGVQPVLGRGFSDADYAPAAEGTDPVILSHAFWQRRFGGDITVLGRTLSLDARPSLIVGVMPAGFRFLDLAPQPDVILPYRIDRIRTTLGNLNSNSLARLKDGVTLAEANGDVARMLRIWPDAWPPGGAGRRETVVDWQVAPALRPLKDDVVSDVAGMLWLLMGTVGGVLLIACANVANLLLVRADVRRQELAIRAALGAGRRRIAGELMRESFVLSALGSIAGLALAYTALQLLAAFAPANLPRVEDIAIDTPVLAFTVAAALVSSLALGAVPAVKHAFGSEGLPETGARGASASRARNRTRDALIVVQVALALVLLVGAGLMIRTSHELTAIDPGFTEPEKIQFARIFIPFDVMAEPERYNQAYRDILDRIAALPGVSAAGFGDVPLDGLRGGPGTTISVQDRPDAADDPLPSIRLSLTSPGHLEALGTHLIAGRMLTWADTENDRKVAVVSENLARSLWGEPQTAIGERIRWESRDGFGVWHEIVGVTQDVLDELYQAPPATVYPPVSMNTDLRAVTYAIRSERAGTESLVNEVRQAVSATHRDLPVFDVRTMRDIRSDAFARTSFMLVLLAIAGVMALILSVVGIYGAISYTVSQRSREIGIRLALGAQPPAVKRMFVLHGLGVATIGVAVGLAPAAALGRWMASLLFEVPPLDPTTYFAVLGVLLSAAALAAYMPARRAAAIDPANTLRAE